MKIAVVDDENKWINELEEVLFKYKEISKDTEWDVFYSGNALLEQYTDGKTPYDILIIDIEMNGLSGIETANQIRTLDDSVMIFFLSSYSKYMPSSFLAEPLDFWVKPITFEKVKIGFKRAKEKINKLRKTIEITSERKKIRLRTAAIIYINNEDRKSVIHTKQNVYKTNQSLSSLMTNLGDDFARVSNYYIINLNCIEAAYDDTVIPDAEKIPDDMPRAIAISRTYKKEFDEKYLKYEVEKLR